MIFLFNKFFKKQLAANVVKTGLEFQEIRTENYIVEKGGSDMMLKKPWQSKAMMVLC